MTKTLADGTVMKYGTLPSGLKWQSSGILVAGSKPPSPHQSFIEDSYELHLNEDPNSFLDPKHLSSPRQRVEFRSPVDAEDGTRWRFSWKSFHPTSLSMHKLLSLEAGTTFFHLAQVFSQKDSLPSYTLSLFKSQAIIKAHIANITLASVPLQKFLGVPLKHSLDLTIGGDGSGPGVKGRFIYTIEDARNGEVILSAEREGYTGAGGVYIKFGTYRKTHQGMGPSKAWCGDYTCEELFG